jgi:hypothetical protein
MSLSETPWVDRSLKSLLSQLRGRVPADWLPRFNPQGTKVVEFGCGHYGCVMPTSAEGLVFKITTDVSEAAFVARALTLEPASGIVEYKKIFSTDLQHRHRPMFVLWRTEVSDVGKWRYGGKHYPPHLVFGEERQRIAKEDPNYQYAYRVEREADTLLRHFLDYGRMVRAYMYPHFQKLQKEIGRESVWGHDPETGHIVPDDPNYTPRLVDARRKLLTASWAAYERMDPVTEMSPGRAASLRGLDRVGMALRTCLYTAQEMSGNPSLYRVGEALAHYLEEGILLADVHKDNIGLDAEGEAIISDPGHSVEFHPKWAEPPKIERL